MNIIVKYLTWLIVIPSLLSCSGNIPKRVINDKNYNITGKELYYSQKILNEICLYNKIKICPNIFLVDHGFRAKKNVIFLGKYSIRELPNYDALVFIIAHEVAHNIFSDSSEKLIFLKRFLRSAPGVMLTIGTAPHILGNIIYKDQKIEYRADIEGIKLMKKAGFDITKANLYVKYLAEKEVEEITRAFQGNKDKAAINLLNRHLLSHPLWINRKINIELFLRNEETY